MTNWQALAEKYRAALRLIASRGGKVIIEDDYDKGTGIWCAGQAKDALMQEWAEKCSDGLESKMFEDVRKVCAEDHQSAPEPAKQRICKTCQWCTRAPANLYSNCYQCNRRSPVAGKGQGCPWPIVDLDWSCGEWQAVNAGIEFPERSGGKLQ
jgi:hypothetical protein